MGNLSRRPAAPSATPDPAPEPTAMLAPTPHPDHQEPTAECTRKYCKRIENYQFCHYYTPDGWVQRTHVD
ncbi:MAG: hypothetical protein KTV68_06905 [Acidimicrobiia bacterium]|nr:hypothetical protein [Acidimicrobiia bacterium]MCY4433294.1 hypothetical protein [bacterium]